MAATLTQTGAGKDSITIGWNNLTYSGQTLTGLKVSVGPDYQHLKAVGNPATNAKSYTIKGLSAGTEYYVQLEYTYKTKYGSNKSSYKSTSRGDQCCL